MFAKLFIVALAVVCASAGIADRTTRGVAYTHPVSAYSSVPVTSYSAYSAPVTSYSAYSSYPVAYSGSPVAYSGSPVAYSAYSSPVVASPYVYGRSYYV